MKPKQITYTEIANLKQQHPELQLHDKSELAIDELFDIVYPAKKDTKTAQEVEEYSKQKLGEQPGEWGCWFYYPWLNTVVHFPPKEDLWALRTSRNRNLITSGEQKKLLDSTILIAGMSVGSNIVEALVSQGIGGRYIIADMDSIEPSNLNRIRSPYHHVGLAKVDAIARKVWEIDPYIEVVQLAEGISEANLEEQLGKYHVNVIVDEIDDLKMKIMIREKAKAHSLPVVMAADDGDDSLIDIERYDAGPQMEIFNGRIPKDVISRIKTEDIPRAELGVMIGKYFVGIENTPLRMLESLVEVGKSLPSWPQLGGAAALSGVAIAYVVRKIILSYDIYDGRVLISLDEKLDKQRLTDEHKEKLAIFYKMMEG